MLLRVQFLVGGRAYQAGVHVDTEGLVSTVPPVLVEFRGMHVRDFLHFARVNEWKVTRLDQADPVIEHLDE